MSTNRQRIGILFLIVWALMTLLLAACSGGSEGKKEESAAADNGNAPAGPTKEPMELTVYYMGSDSSEERFMEVYGDAIRRGHPNFTLKWMNYNTVKFADLAATQTKVDLFYGPMGNYASVVNGGYADLSCIVLI
ncbi:hypothetical protein FE784_18125 [Paenibacillus hemerocallicola]|uniref:Extracellular solute-binding protein n=1 Tax=Paenibacillus hemerocallicola TaxID=1172614 RepID=A0A5C4T6T0_9BACL|nr:hypothetical protein [Paenibacillus hemerocallicola]TNJ64768.1 hypothetical protein FE784_18125 [Paenibacillus hemerocallicola]